MIPQRIFGKINMPHSDSLGWVGAGTSIIFTVCAGYRYADTELLFFFLLTLRELATVWFFLTRNTDEKGFGGLKNPQTLLVYVSLTLPLLYLNEGPFTPQYALVTAELLAIIGFAISTIALFELGTSFGVAPVNRGKVNTGIYGLVKHPMYTGYVIVELGMILINPLNIIIFVLSVGAFVFRAKCEEKALNAS